MSFGRYIKSLLPSFEKSRMEDDIKSIKEELGVATIEPYKSASEHFKDHDFSSRDNKDFDRIFKRDVKVESRLKGNNYVTTVYNVLDRSLSTLPIVENRVEELFGDKVTAEGMTFARANVLRYVELLYFVSRYARRLLMLTYHNERLASGRESENPFSPAEMDWLLRNQRTFIHGIGVVSHSDKDLRAMFSNIPNMVIIPEEEENVNQTVGKMKLDPMRTGFINPLLNPIYHVRMHYTDFLVSRYKLAQEEKRSLEYRLLSLKEIGQGRDDPKLEQQIEYTENRIRKLNRKLAKMEED